MKPNRVDATVFKNTRKTVSAKTPTQQLYVDTIKDKEVVFGVGPAGTGKTYLAVSMALTFLMQKKVKRLVLTRPAVEAGEKLGFLPGDMAEKVNPYLRPLFDALHDLLEPEQVSNLLEGKIIEIAPLAFMRGRTLSDAFVILDEAQNTTPQQMKMLLTRMGSGSRMVITGDATQVDLTGDSGLMDAVSCLSNVEGIGVVTFSDEDVVRHPLVARIIRAYEARDQEQEYEEEDFYPEDYER